ncbi:outer membrane protein [Thiogranum longum]|uniref:Outer membrane protein n=1 Tax=Thiogranum longum TaxID=1537524 RepID=A0A4R1HG98_9GAMM|nr:TolC family outer membrane protein [Thiogranum longum]TCK19435.1 outer membrane protein [Thiogranum longum]
MKILLLSVFLLLTSRFASAADLITVYEVAARNNPTLSAAAASLDASRESHPQAFAGLLPNLNAGASMSRSRFKNTDPSQDATYSTDKQASINLVQPLFRYDRWIALKQADSTIAAAEADYAAAQQTLMVDVAERYFAVLDAQDNLEFAQAEKSAIGRQLDQAKQRFDVGLIAITDVKAAQARYDIAVSQEIRAVSELEGSRDALRELTGEYFDKLDLLREDLKLVRPDPDSPEHWIAQAKQQNLQVLSAEAASEAARQEMRRQRAGHLPTLDLNASASYQDVNFGGIAPIKRQDSEIGVQLNIPLYQGGSVSSRTRQARSQFEEATQRLQEAVRAAELATRNAWRGIRTDIAQVRALGESLESTRVAVEAEEAGFEVGTRTIVDVLNAQREHYLARLNYARARSQYVVDQLRLKRATGILARDDLVEVNRTLTPASE